MTTYTLEDWAVRPFPTTFSNVAIALGFPRPQLAVAGADGLICYDRNAGQASLFATVQQGALDNGTPVQNGPLQMGNPQTFDRRWSQIVPGAFGKSGALVLFYDATTGVGEFYGIAGKNGPLKLIQRITGFRTSWTHIVAAKFSDSKYDHLLLYDKTAGTEE